MRVPTLQLDRPRERPSHDDRRPSGPLARRGVRFGRGVAAVEFALILPLLLVILFGIIDFGLMLYDKAVITNAAREGARAGIVLRNPRLTKAEIEAVANNYCRGAVLRIAEPAPCTATATLPSPVAFGAELVVRVDYTYEGPIMRLIQLVGGQLSIVDMSSVARMKYE